MTNKPTQSQPSLKHFITEKESLELLSKKFGVPVTMGKEKEENMKEIVFLRKKKTDEKQTEKK